MRVCFLVDRRLGDPKSPVMNAAAFELSQRGHAVSSVLFSDIQLDVSRIEVDADLYISKASSELQISLAGILNDRGARLLNTWQSSSYVRDKARVTAALEAAGFPVPRTCIATDCAQAAATLGGLPIIVKPVRGTAGRGIEIVRSEADYGRVGRGPHFAQSFQRLNSDDLKVYVIGDDVSIVRRPFPARTLEDKLGSGEHNREIEAMAMRIGQLFGLEIYGVDVVETANGPVVVDVNACPGFVGAPGAGRRLADYIDRALREQTHPRRALLKVVGE